MALMKSILIIVVSLYLLIGIICLIDMADFFKESEKEIKNKNFLDALCDRFTVLFLIFIVVTAMPVVISTQYVYSLINKRY